MGLKKQMPNSLFIVQVAEKLMDIEKKALDPCNLFLSFLGVVSYHRIRTVLLGKGL